jgi:hypothetical protein
LEWLGLGILAECRPALTLCFGNPFPGFGAEVSFPARLAGCLLGGRTRFLGSGNGDSRGTRFLAAYEGANQTDLLLNALFLQF